MDSRFLLPLAWLPALAIAEPQPEYMPDEAIEIAERLDYDVSWVGNNYPLAAKYHVQQVINDIDAHGGLVAGNATWDEGLAHTVLYSAEGELHAVLSNEDLAPRGFWVEGGHGIALTEDYVYTMGMVRRTDPKTREEYIKDVLYRFDREGKPAPFETSDFNENGLVINDFIGFSKGTPEQRIYLHRMDDSKKPRGVAVLDGELFVSNTRADRIDVIRLADMQPLPERSIPCVGPLWITSTPEGKLWVSRRDTAEVTEFTPGKGTAQVGRPTGRSIRDVEVPTDLDAVGANELWVGDSGLERQHIRIYDRKSLKLKKTFGQPAYGKVQDDSFFGISGVAVDPVDGTVYAASHGMPGEYYMDQAHGRVGRGAELKKYDTDFKMDWRLMGTEFVHCGGLDPKNETHYYTTENIFEMNLDVEPVAGPNPPHFRMHAYTMDPVNYPNDPRMHIYFKGARIIYIEGEKFLFIHSDYRGMFEGLYRFEGDIAVPAVLWTSNTNYKLGLQNNRPFPPNMDVDTRSAVWMDLNGNGDFESNEFTPLENQWKVRAFHPDGSLYALDNDSITRVPLKEINEHGVPVFATEAMATAPIDEYFTRITRLSYVAEEDVAFISGFTETHPIQSGNSSEYNIAGRVIYRLDAFSKLFDNDPNTKPTTVWTLDQPALPYRVFNMGHLRKAGELKTDSIHAVDTDYLFVPYDRDSQPNAEGKYVPREDEPDTRVYNAKDGSLVGLIEPRGAIGNHTGLYDFGHYAVSLQKLADGRYVIFTEDYVGGKNPIFIWKP